MDEWRIEYVSTNDNVADLLTKAIPSGEKRNKFINMLLHRIKKEWRVQGTSGTPILQGF